MGISAAIPILLSIALAALLLVSRTRFKRRLMTLTARCERAESEWVRLETALATREAAEQQRLSRLEHDLRSAMSVVVGFASILSEQAEKTSNLQPSLVLKSANAIRQSATKTLQILDNAATAQLEDATSNAVEGKL